MDTSTLLENDCLKELILEKNTLKLYRENINSWKVKKVIAEKIHVLDLEIESLLEDILENK